MAADSIELNAENLEGEYETKEQGHIVEVDDSPASSSRNIYRNSAVIHAANTGYQAKMRGDVGSYLLSSFIYRVELNQARHERKGLEELMEEIQNSLHRAGRQQMIAVFHNTEHLILERKLSMKKPL